MFTWLQAETPHCPQPGSGLCGRYPKGPQGGGQESQHDSWSLCGARPLPRLCLQTFAAIFPPNVLRSAEETPSPPPNVSVLLDCHIFTLLCGFMTLADIYFTTTT